MRKLINSVLLGVLFGVLVAIRAYAPALFYDPLISFFKTTHSTAALPEFHLGKLILAVSSRFWLNTVISLGILGIWFQKKEVVRFSTLVYVVFFSIMMLVFLVLLKVSQPGEYMALFYVRRFLIHPVLLLLLIPAFYFQKGRK